MLYKCDNGWKITYIEEGEVIEHLNKGCTICKAEEEEIKKWNLQYRNNLSSIMVNDDKSEEKRRKGSNRPRRN
jgi:hypothetical protein